jgi:hypothetical protein
MFIKPIVISFVILLSLKVNAFQCRALFANSSSLIEIGRGFEGRVYLNEITGLAEKIFDFRIQFEDTLAIHDLLAEHMKAAGFRIPDVLEIDKQQYRIVREFVNAEPLALVEREMTSFPDTHKKWRHVAYQYEVLYYRLMERLENETRFKFNAKKYIGANLPVISGFISHRGREYYVSIHEFNILTNVDYTTNQAEFFIIDYR